MMAKRAQRSRDAKKAKRDVARITPEPWIPPAKGDCDEEKREIFLDNDHRIVQRLTTWNGQLVDYAIVLICREVQGWVEIASIDCCHSTVHRHDEGHGASSVIRTIYTQSDVQSSINESFDEIFDRFTKGQL